MQLQFIVVDLWLSRPLQAAEVVAQLETILEERIGPCQLLRWALVRVHPQGSKCWAMVESVITQSQ